MFFKKFFNNKEDQEIKSFNSINCITTSNSTNSLWSDQKSHENNPIVFRSIQLISECANSMEIITKFEDKTLQKYLNKNFGDIIMELLIHGNCFLHKDLFLISPNKIAINTNKYNKITGYTINNIFYEKNHILHLKYCNNSRSNFFSISPIQVCEPWIEIYKFIQNYISVMVQYGGKPSGILSYTSMMNEKDRTILKEQFKDLYGNVNKGGAVILTSSNISWQPIGMEPDKLNLLNNLKQATKEIANCFGIPVILLGDTEKATFSNYMEARKQLWEDVVIPLSKNIIGKISEFFNQEIELHKEKLKED